MSMRPCPSYDKKIITYWPGYSSLLIVYFFQVIIHKMSLVHIVIIPIQHNHFGRRSYCIGPFACMSQLLNRRGQELLLAAIISSYIAIYPEVIGSYCCRHNMVAIIHIYNDCLPLTTPALHTMHRLEHGIPLVYDHGSMLSFHHSRRSLCYKITYEYDIGSIISVLVDVTHRNHAPMLRTVPFLWHVCISE